MKKDKIILNHISREARRKILKFTNKENKNKEAKDLKRK